eukprot:Amastigsp_a676753_229.p3 type:complete len:132 gc:universal Amastigsp_a676753_229:827-432(-)
MGEALLYNGTAEATRFARFVCGALGSFRRSGRRGRCCDRRADACRRPSRRPRGGRLRRAHAAHGPARGRLDRAHDQVAPRLAAPRRREGDCHFHGGEQSRDCVQRVVRDGLACGAPGFRVLCRELHDVPVL